MIVTLFNTPENKKMWDDAIIYEPESPGHKAQLDEDEEDE